MARALPGRSDILHSIRQEGRALHVSELGAKLQVRPASRRRLRELLEQLVLDGSLSAVPGDRFRIPEARGLESWEGALSVHPRGFAFVNAAGREDVFVPPTGIGAALHGDTVEVGIVGRSTRGAEGRVQKIVRRRHPRIPGVLRRRRKSAWLEPDDERIRGPIVIIGDLEGATDGAAAVVNITHFPEAADETPMGELTSVLGTPGDAQVEVAKILARDNIQEERDPAAQRDAEARAAALTPVSLSGRRDMRKLPFLTIDPVDARDHDDAIHVERRPEGYRAYVAIADVSEYVQPKTALDLDASERCFTTYLPDRAVPMLPAVLASQHCSLLPKQDRYALCAIVDLDKDATVQRFRLVEAVIHVAALLTYEDAACTLGFIEEEPKHPEAKSFKKNLRVLADLARKLRKLRMKRGALDLDLPEPKVELDRETGRPVSVTRRAKNPGIVSAYQLVEELMLLANERVARWLSGKKSPAVYRVHAPPDPERLEQLGLAAQKLGVAFDRDTLDSPLGVARWMKRIAKHPLRSVLEGLLLRSMKLAQYDIKNVGHFGLASEAYLHFTSPIRRYPDLLVHRISKAILRGEPIVTDPAAIEVLRAATTRSSEIERVVMQAEREVVDLYRCLLMQDKVGEVYEARITGLAGSGVYAVLDEPFVDVLLRHESLGPDRYEQGDDGLSVVGRRSGDRIALGDRVTIVIEDVALLRRTIYGRRVPPADVFAGIEPVVEDLDRPPPRRNPALRARSDRTESGAPRQKSQSGRRSASSGPAGAPVGGPACRLRRQRSRRWQQRTAPFRQAAPLAQPLSSPTESCPPTRAHRTVRRFAVTAPYTPAGAAEFPNDNPVLHRGARWVCLAPRGPARAVLRPATPAESPAAASARLGSPEAAPVAGAPREPTPPAPAPPASVRRYEGPLELDLHRIVIPHRVENVPPPPDFIFTPFVPARRFGIVVAVQRAIQARPCQVVDEREACRRVERGRRVDVAPCLEVGSVESARRPSRQRSLAARAVALAEEVADGPLELEAVSA